MARLGTRSDGTPYTPRLSARTRRIRAYKEKLVAVDLDALAKAPNLEILELAGNPIRTLDLTPLAACPNLRELTIGADTPIDLAPLAGCPALASLRLEARGWTTLDLSPLAGHPSLASLSFTVHALTSLDLTPLASCPNLRRLSIAARELDRLDLAPLAPLDLTNLYVESRRLDRVDLAPARDWPNLATLQLMQAPIRDLDLTPLRATALTRLHLAGHALRRLDLTPLAALETLEGFVLDPMPTLVLEAGSPDAVAAPALQDYLEEGWITLHTRRTDLDAVLREIARRSAAEGTLTESSAPPIDEAAFWRLIEAARATAPDAGERRSGASPITAEIARRLVALDRERVAGFRRIFWRLMGRVSDRAHDHLAGLWGGCSDDTFLDVRQWLIAQGEATFARVVDDPTALGALLPHRIDPEESIVSRAITAVEQAQTLAVEEDVMVRWLAHPMEYGERPAEIEAYHHETTRWPLHERPVDLFLHRYRMTADGPLRIGMTGPITWSFLNTDLGGLDPTTLKWLFAGWHVAFTTVQAETYDRAAQNRERAALTARIQTSEPSFIEMLDYLRIGELTFYAYRAAGPDGAESIVARGADYRATYPADAAYLRVPPLYIYIGSLFFAGKL